MPVKIRQRRYRRTMASLSTAAVYPIQRSTIQLVATPKNRLPMRTGAAFTAALTFCLGGWFVGLANALGETEAKDCAVAIAGSSVEASSISNVCGVPPELLAAIVEEFTQ